MNSEAINSFGRVITTSVIKTNLLIIHWIRDKYYSTELLSLSRKTSYSSWKQKLNTHFFNLSKTNFGLRLLRCKERTVIEILNFSLHVRIQGKESQFWMFRIWKLCVIHWNVVSHCQIKYRTFIGFQYLFEAFHY